MSRTYKNKDSMSIKKGNDTRAHRSLRLLPELEQRLDSTLDSRQGFACATNTKPEPLQVENYKMSVGVDFHREGVFIGVNGTSTDLERLVWRQVMSRWPSHMAAQSGGAASTDSGFSSSNPGWPSDPWAHSA
jgi:hypothetical protein